MLGAVSFSDGVRVVMVRLMASAKNAKENSIKEVSNVILIIIIPIAFVIALLLAS